MYDTVRGRSRTSGVDRQWIIIAIIMALGAALRFYWAIRQAMHQYPHATGEAYNVAVAIAQGRGIADAYQVGQGPTAHVTPITPAIGGAVYYLLGVGSLPAEALLTCWAVALTMLSYWLAFKAFGHLGASTSARIAGLAILCLLPIYISFETIEFRIWDGALVAALGGLLLCAILKADKAPAIDRWTPIRLSALGACLFFLNPNVGLAGYAAIFLLMIRRYDWRQRGWQAASTVVALVIVITPWAIRNDRVMGAPIALRSNAGLELAIANHEGALNATDPAGAYWARLDALHPIRTPAAYAAMQAAGGEVPYFRQLGQTTRQWMIAHPAEALSLYALHVSEVFFPRMWQIGMFGSDTRNSLIRMILSWTISIAAIIALVRRLGRNDYIWLYPLIFLAVPALAYGFFQPISRYVYVLHAAMVMLAADLVVGLALFRMKETFTNRASARAISR